MQRNARGRGDGAHDARGGIVSKPVVVHVRALNASARVACAAFSLVAAGAVLGACIIGPKQDDPAQDRGDSSVPTEGSDTGSVGGGLDGASDSGLGFSDTLSADAPAPPADDCRDHGDGGGSSVTDATSDATSDARCEAGDASDAGDAPDGADGGVDGDGATGG